MELNMAAALDDGNVSDNDAPDVSEARLKLDDLLNEIVDKTEDSCSDDESKRSGILGSAVTTPSKRQYSGRAPRKKKKKDSVTEEFLNSTKLELSYDVGANHMQTTNWEGDKIAFCLSTMSVDDGKHGYIIKLFDRRVDLAKFDEDTPLYVMVREWMKNKPYSIQQQQLFLEQESVTMIGPQNDERTNNTGDCERNPAIELPNPVKNEDQAYPRPLPPALKTALIENIINTESDIEELRKDNMARWSKVRKRWKEHSFRQQQRYYGSLQILKKSFISHTGG